MCAGSKEPLKDTAAKPLVIRAREATDLGVLLEIVGDHDARELGGIGVALHGVCQLLECEPPVPAGAALCARAPMAPRPAWPHRAQPTWSW